MPRLLAYELHDRLPKFRSERAVEPCPVAEFDGDIAGNAVDPSPSKWDEDPLGDVLDSELSVHHGLAVVSRTMTTSRIDPGVKNVVQRTLGRELEHNGFGGPSVLY